MKTLDEVKQFKMSKLEFQPDDLKGEKWFWD